jgi:hypothetical protein
MAWLWLVRGAHAQEDVDVLFTGGSFLVAIVAGLILALGFQLVLTNLSVAAGVTALGPFDRDERKRRDLGLTAERTAGYDRNVAYDGDVTVDRSVSRAPTKIESTDARGWGVMARKATAALGVWALLTASVSLFFASWLAVELSVTLSALGGAILGLVIWGLFYLILSAFEATAAWSLAGSLLRGLTGTFQTGYRAVTSAFASPPEDRMAEAAARITKAVTDELRQDLALDDLRGDLRKYVKQLAPQPIDPKAIRNEVMTLLRDVELRTEVTQTGDAFDPRETVVTRLVARGFGREDAQAIAESVRDAVNTVREEQASGKDNVSAVIDAGLRRAGYDPADAVATRQKIEGWLRETGKEALSPEGIKGDLERLFTSPAEGAQALKQRFAALDRDTVAQIVAQRGDLSEQDARAVVDGVLAYFRSAQERLGELRRSVPDAPRAPDLEARLRAWVDGLRRPELDYEGIKYDLMHLFDDPKASTESILARVRALDRDTVKAILASRADWTEDDAERVLKRIEDARDSVLSRAEQLKTDVQHRIEDARVEALHQADEARQTAATAAWWSFGTAVVSGAAAAAGGVAAVAF